MINSEYLLRKTDALYEAYSAQKEQIELDNEAAFMRNQTYADLRYQLKACVFDLQKAKAFGDDKKISACRQSKKEITEKLEALKNTLDIKENVYLPHCDKCNDTGFDGNKRCYCYYDNLTTIAYEYLNIKKPKLNTFDNNTLTDVKTLNRIEKLKKYCDNFSEHSKNLLFLGDRGTGKTFLAEAIADRLINGGKTVLLINAFQLNDIFLKIAYTNRQDYFILKQILTTCDLLIIDDLGAAPILKNITAENLLMIITERQALSNPYIVTSNLNVDEINILFDERVYSRMCGKTSNVVSFKGKNLRLYN